MHLRPRVTLPAAAGIFDSAALSVEFQIEQLYLGIEKVDLGRGETGRFVETRHREGFALDALQRTVSEAAIGSEENVPSGFDGKIYMDGREVFRNAVVEMGKAAVKAVSDAGLELSDVDLLIPHQANVRIIDATARRVKLPAEKVYVNIASYGNTSAASIPIALTEALEQGRITPGAHIVFVAFGGGLTWGAAALRWGERTTAIATSDARLPDTDKTGSELLLERQERRRARRRG